MNCYFARMVMQAVIGTPALALTSKLKTIAEDPATNPEIVNLAARFLRAESRASGLERWPELYELISGRDTRPVNSIQKELR
jgi:hypothetical protein